MSPEQNKAIVLEAFEALFNRKDFKGASDFWAKDYIQHNPLIPNGREALFHYVGSLPASTRFEYQLAVAEGDFVMVHGRYSDNGFPVPWIVVDILRMKDGVMVEHWDVIQDEANIRPAATRCSGERSSDRVFRKRCEQGRKVNAER